MIPQTPPRVKRVVTQTPQETPQVKVNNDFKKFKTPISKKHLLPQTPDTAGPKLKLPSTNLLNFARLDHQTKLTLPATPEKSPRRKKKCSPSDKLNFGLLLPLPSKIGSGRNFNHSSVKVINNTPKLNHEYFAEVNRDFQFEEDIADQPPLQLSESSKKFLQKSKNISTQLFAQDTFKSSAKSSFGEKSIFNESPFATSFSENSVFNPVNEVPEEVSLAPPMTPGKQILTDKQVASWHEKPSAINFSVEESEYEDMKSVSVELPNPFDEASFPKSKSHNPFLAKNHEINYSTHMEYVNNRTGKRTVVELTEEQKQIKPKKLDFSGL